MSVRVIHSRAERSLKAELQRSAAVDNSVFRITDGGSRGVAFSLLWKSGFGSDVVIAQPQQPWRTQEMTREATTDRTLFDDAMEVVSERGFDGMAQVFAVLMNEAMKIERQKALQAAPYERSEERRGHANGFKPKTVATRMGEVTLQVPQVRGMSFYPQSLEKGCRSEKALKLAIAEMYIAGVSTRKVTAITEKLCGLDISSTQVSRLSSLLDAELDAFRNRKLEEPVRYVFLDARYEKVRHDNRVISHAVLIAVGVTESGRRSVLGVSVSLSEAEPHWRTFLQSLVERGLHGVRLIVSDDHAGLKAARQAVLPSVPWQRCQFHFAQNAQAYVPKRSMREEIAEAVRSIFASSTVDAARLRTRQVVEEYKERAPEFTRWLEENVEDCFAVYGEPTEFHKRLRTVNGVENINRELKRRTRVASIFPNAAATLRLVTALLIEIHEEWMSNDKPYLNMKRASQQTTKQ